MKASGLPRLGACMTLILSGGSVACLRQAGSAVPALKEALKDEHSNVSRYAAEALKKIQKKE